MIDEGQPSGRLVEPVEVGDPAVVEEPAARVVDSTSPGEGVALAHGAVHPEAMRDLAVAFRTSAQAIDGVRELQGELVKTLKRQDRSELVLRSTDALNESFRNLTAVQRELLTRLDRANRDGPGRLVPLMVIGLLVVFLGGIYAIVSLLDQIRSEQQDPALVAEQALAAFREGLVEGGGRQAEEVARLGAEMARLREREEGLRLRLEREGEVSAETIQQVRLLEGERESLAQQVLAAQNEVLAKRMLEEELRATTGHLAIVEPRLADLEREIESEREENAKLRRRLAAIGYGLPVEDVQPLRGEQAPEEAQPPAPADRRVDRDPELLEKIRGRINQILEQGGPAQPSFWQIVGLAGVSPEGLVDVSATLYERQSRRLLQEVKAEEVRFRVDRAQRTAEMLFLGGTIKDTRGARQMPESGMSFRVARGEMSRLWSQSGLIFVRFR